MFKIKTIAMVVSMVVTVANLLVSGPLVAEELTSWASPAGRQRFERAKQKVDFFQLAPQFETQKNKMLCGPTSATIVLNALRPGEVKSELKSIDAKNADAALLHYLPANFEPRFKRYTQDNVFNPAAVKKKSLAQVYGAPILGAENGKPDYGLQLRQLHELFLANGAHSLLRIADESLSDAQIKQEIIDNLDNPSDYVVANFLLQTSSVAKGIGHISPVAAYDKKSDSFLIMDVHPTHDGWYWIPSSQLITAMRTKDTIENRGYLSVHEMQ